MKIIGSRIPKSKRVLKDRFGNKFNVVEYEYNGMHNLYDSYVIVKDATCFQEFTVTFAEMRKLFPKECGEDFAKCIERYDEKYVKPIIETVDDYDENGNKLTAEDWAKMLENLDMPRDKYESRPVVCGSGKLYYNASRGCKDIGDNPANCSHLYRAVEKKHKYKKLYWRYATASEIKDEIKKMTI